MRDRVVDSGLGYWKRDSCMKSAKGKLLASSWPLGCLNRGREHSMEGSDMKDPLENFFGSIGTFAKEELFSLFSLGGSSFFDFAGCIY